MEVWGFVVDGGAFGELLGMPGYVLAVCKLWRRRWKTVGGLNFVSDF